MIVTTSANELLEPIHVAHAGDARRSRLGHWLDPANGDLGALESMLRPAPDDWLELYPVSTRVNSPDNNDSDLIHRSSPTRSCDGPDARFVVPPMRARLRSMLL